MEDERFPESERMRRLREFLLEALENPMPDEKLRRLMRSVKIRCHIQFATQAADQLRRYGQVDEMMQGVLDFNRRMMQDYGIGAIAK